MNQARIWIPVILFLAILTHRLHGQNDFISLGQQTCREGGAFVCEIGVNDFVKLRFNSFTSIHWQEGILEGNGAGRILPAGPPDPFGPGWDALPMCEPQVINMEYIPSYPPIPVYNIGPRVEDEENLGGGGSIQSKAAKWDYDIGGNRYYKAEGERLSIEGNGTAKRAYIRYPDRSESEYLEVDIQGSYSRWRIERTYRGPRTNPDWQDTYYYDDSVGGHGGLVKIVTRRGIEVRYNWSDHDPAPNQVAMRVDSITMSAPWSTTADWALLTVTQEYETQAPWRLIKVTRPQREVVEDRNRDGIVEDHGNKSIVTTFEYNGATSLVSKVIDATILPTVQKVRNVYVSGGWRVAQQIEGPEVTGAPIGQGPKLHSYSYPGSIPITESPITWTSPGGQVYEYISLLDTDDSLPPTISRIGSNPQTWRVKHVRVLPGQGPNNPPNVAGLVTHASLVYDFEYSSSDGSPPTLVVLPSGIRIEYEYDTEGRYYVTKKTTVPVDASLPPRVDEWIFAGWHSPDYRAASRLLTYCDALGDKVSYVYTVNATAGTVDIVNSITRASGTTVTYAEFVEDNSRNILSATEKAHALYGGGTGALQYQYIYGANPAHSDFMLVKERKRNGATVTNIEYEGPGWVAKVRDANNIESTMERDSYGALTRSRVPIGNSGGGGVLIQDEVFQYSSSGQISRTRTVATQDNGALYPLQGVVREFAHDPFMRLWRRRLSTAKLGATQTPSAWDTVEIVWNEGHNVVRQRRLGSSGATEFGSEEFKRDGFDRVSQHVTQMTGAQFRVRSFGWDADGQISTTRDGLNRDTTTIFNAHREIVEVVDHSTRRLKYTRDAVGRLLCVDTLVGGVPVTRTENVFDVNTAHLIKVREHDLVSTNVAETSFEYTGFGRLSKVISPEGRERLIEYDPVGRAVSQSDGHGNSVVTTFDALDRVVHTRTSVFKDDGGSGSTVHYDVDYVYNDAGDLITVTDSGDGSGATAVMQFAYDSLRQRVGVVDPNGKSTRLEFDAIGRQVKLTHVSKPGHSDPAIVNAVEYDDEPTAAGIGRRVIRTDGEGRTTEVLYDLGGRMAVRRLPGYSAVSGAHEWQYTYDVENQLQEWRDGNGAVVKQAFDAVGRLTDRWLAQSGSQLLSFYCTNEKMAYDSMLRPAGGTTYWGQFGNTSAPNINAYSLVRLDVVADGFARIERETFGWGDDGAHNPLPAAIKNVTSSWEAGGVQDYSFRRSVSTDVGFNLQYVPDFAGRLSATNLSGPNALSVTNFTTHRYVGEVCIGRTIDIGNSSAKLWANGAVDYMGRLESTVWKFGGGSAADPVKYQISVARDKIGNVLRREHPAVVNGVGDVYLYDGHDRVKTALLDVGSLVAPHAEQRSIGYSLDRAHNRAGVNDSALQVPATYSLESQSNRYADVGDMPYTYDGNGNLICDGYYVYVYDYLDRLSEAYLITYPEGAFAQSVSRQAWPSKTQQSERRGLPTKLKPDRVAELVRAVRLRVELARNKSNDMRLSRQVSEQSSVEVGEPVLSFVAAYAYDVYNRRVFKNTAAGATFFAWDGAGVKELYDGWWSAKATCLHGANGQLLAFAEVDNGGTWKRYATLSDDMRSVVRIVDEGGNVVERSDYAPYGSRVVRNASGQVVSDSAYRVKAGFSGHWHDSETGLLYMVNRYYMPSIGRFLTNDPAGIWFDGIAGGNGYAYAGSNPVSLWDPDGLQARQDEKRAPGGETVAQPKYPYKGTSDIPDPSSRGTTIRILSKTQPKVGDRIKLTGVYIGDSGKKKNFGGTVRVTVVNGMAFTAVLERESRAFLSFVNFGFGLVGSLFATPVGWGFVAVAMAAGLTNAVITGEYGAAALDLAFFGAGTVVGSAIRGLRGVAGAAARSGETVAGAATRAARQLGRAGEAAAGIVKNTERIASATGTAAYRVPDVLNHSAKIIGEVKNVGSLSYTSQLRDFAAYAAQNGYTFELTVRSTTQLSGALQQAVANGSIVLRFLP